MMKNIFKLSVLLIMSVFFIGCNLEQNQEKTPLPSFDVSVEMHENVLVFDNSGSNVDSNGNELNEIVLFDVDKSKILYKYSFDKELRIYKIAYKKEPRLNEPSNGFIGALTARHFLLCIYTT